MNRGSALKWADLIEDEKYQINMFGGCLKDGDGHFDYFGILVDFVNNGVWNNTGLGFFTTPDGHCASIPENVKKKCKIKSDLNFIEAISDGPFLFSNGEQLRFNTSYIGVRNAVAEYIRENYESL